MLTAVAVDSQMANGNRFGYQQVIPHSPFHCKHPLGLVYVLQARKKNFPVAWLSHRKPVQVCQDRYINGSDQEKPVIPTQKAYWTRLCLAVNPSGTTQNAEVIIFNRQRQYKKVNASSDFPSI